MDLGIIWKELGFNLAADSEGVEKFVALSRLPAINCILFGY